jgi:TonB family protein
MDDSTSMRQFISTLGTVSLIAANGVATAQTSPAECKTKLTAAAADSQVLQLQVLVTPFDTAQHVPLRHQGMIGEGIRQFLVVPRSLSLDVYQPMNKDAWPTIKGAYRTTLHRDGHFTQTRTVGGTRNRGLDSAIVAAIGALDTAQLLPPPDSATIGDAESIDLRILVAPGRVFPTTMKTPPATREGVTALLHLRVPIRGASGAPYPKTNNPHPVYPSALREARVQGVALFEFVVDANGVPDVSTAQVIRATAPQFAEAVLDVLPKLRFDPLLVEGCPVGALVQMPFQFSLTPR